MHTIVARMLHERETGWRQVDVVLEPSGGFRPSGTIAVGRKAAGLPGELSVHCLRHSYVSHLVQNGVDPLFVQQQVGHSWASTTAVYTQVGADAKNRMLRAALDGAFGRAQGAR